MEAIASDSMVGENLKNIVFENKILFLILGISLIIIFILILWGTCTEKGKSSFGNIKSMFGKKKSPLRDLDVYMFMSPNCKYCHDMMDVLKKEDEISSLKIINKDDEKNKSILQEFSVKDDSPVPLFISKRLKTATYGFKPSVKDLIVSLVKKEEVQSSDEEDSVHKTVKTLGIILFSLETCHICTMSKEMCANLGLNDVVEIVDVMTPKGKEMLAYYGLSHIANFPLFYSRSSRKSVLGHRSIEELIKELS